MLPAESDTVPWEAVPTAVTVRVWVDSLDGPAESLPVRSDAAKASAVSSAVDFESFTAVGASFTSVTVTFTVAVSDFGSAIPLVVPLSGIGRAQCGARV